MGTALRGFHIVSMVNSKVIAALSRSSEASLYPVPLLFLRNVALLEISRCRRRLFDNGKIFFLQVYTFITVTGIVFTIFIVIFVIIISISIIFITVYITIITVMNLSFDLFIKTKDLRFNNSIFQLVIIIIYINNILSELGYVFRFCVLLCSMVISRSFFIISINLLFIPAIFRSCFFVEIYILFSMKAAHKPPILHLHFLITAPSIFQGFFITVPLPVPRNK